MQTSSNEKKELKFGSLNVCGLISKLKIPEFHDCIKRYDYICISETKIDDLDIPLVLENLPLGYTAIFKNRKHVTNVKSGGICIIYKDQ